MKNVESVDMFSIVTNIKKCTKCGEEKELSEYHKNKSSKGGLRPYCKECAREKQREHNSKPEVKKRKKEYSNRPEIKEKRKKYIQSPEMKEKAKRIF